MSVACDQTLRTADTGTTETAIASGIFGQGIYVNPAEDVVIAVNSARANANVDSDWALQTALYEALKNAVRN